AAPGSAAAASSPPLPPPGGAGWIWTAASAWPPCGPQSPGPLPWPRSCPRRTCSSPSGPTSRRHGGRTPSAARCPSAASPAGPVQRRPASGGSPTRRRNSPAGS
ncbi:Transmembrane protein, partial [Dysosmobacter welbionis]